MNYISLSNSNNNYNCLYTIDVYILSTKKVHKISMNISFEFYLKLFFYTLILRIGSMRIHN